MMRERDAFVDRVVDLLAAMTKENRELSMALLHRDVCIFHGILLDDEDDCSLCQEEALTRPLRPLPPEMFNLVPLSSLPESEWKGRGVFHPCSQTGPGLNPLTGITSPVADCQWVADDLTGLRPGTEAYDAGVVTRWEADPDFADLGIVRVWFVGHHGSTLHYASTNLWTHKEQS
jgi:hypothetical protein